VRNFAHAVLFGIQAVLIGLALRPGPIGRPARIWLVASTLALAYGMLTEWRQASLPGRTASWIDVVTDAVGAYGAPWALAHGFRLSRRAVIVLLTAVLFSVAATLS
jgi:VanZ family protein